MQNANTELLKEFQKSWRKRKYWVMSRSQQAYNQIRLLAKGNEWTLEKQQEYEEILLRLEEKQPTDKTLRVAYQHVWGYFKKVATPEEKKKYQELIHESHIDSQALSVFLKALSSKYQQRYLLEIKWF